MIKAAEEFYLIAVTKSRFVFCPRRPSGRKKTDERLYITGSVQSEIQQSAIRACYFIQARVTKSSSTDFQSPSTSVPVDTLK